MPDWITTGFNEYVKRMPPEMLVRLTEIKPDKRIQGKSVERNLEIEREKILDLLPVGCQTIVLDERGKNWTTQELARMLENWQNTIHDLVFIIGSADGLHNDIKRRADYILALSVMTLPHGLARVILAEQLYRATSINRNHPYHRQ